MEPAGERREQAHAVIGGPHCGPNWALTATGCPPRRADLMGSTDEQPTSELVADLLDTARATRTRTMQEVAGARQRAGTITRNPILMASSETGSIERPATNLVTQLHMYILVAGPEAATSRSQPPSL